jgi:lysine-N-methylase
MRKLASVPMLMPRYASRFSCIGGDCEDTCCAGWQVDLDQESFLHYQATFDPVLRPLVTQHVKRNPEVRTSARYGQIEMLASSCRECPFLGPTHLCQIQERLGANALSETCWTFPRSIRALQGVHQMTLSLACPEAARLALLEEDAFDLVEETREISLSAIQETQPVQGVSLEVMDEVRISLFQVLRTQDLSIRERLEVLGLVCEHLSSLLEQKRPDRLPEALQAMDQLLSTGMLVTSEAPVPQRLDLQARVAMAFFRFRRDRTSTPRHRALMDLVEAGLDLPEEGELDLDRLTRAYERGMARLRTDPMAFLVLERYLWNEALQELFPWREATPLDHFASLALRFSVLRLMLVGRAAAQEEGVTPSQWVETVQVFSRNYSHMGGFLDLARSILGKENYHRLDLLYQLL